MFSYIWYTLILLVIASGYALTEILYCKNIINNKFKNLLQCLVPSIILLFLFSLKSPYVGSDSITYYELFNTLKNKPWFPSDMLGSTNHYEIGFLFFTSLFAKLGLPYFVYQFFNYSIICGSLFYSCYKLSKNGSFSIFIFITFVFFNFFISGLRQSIAIALTVFAVSLIISKGKGVFTSLIYFLLFAIAASIHKSALIALPLFFFVNIRNSFLLMVCMLFFSVFVYAFGLPLYEVIYSLLVKLLNVPASGYAQYSGGPGKTPILMILISVFSFCLLKNSKPRNKILTFFKCDICTSESLLDGFLILFVIFGAWLEFLNRFSSGIGRISMYFTIYLIYLLPNAFENLSNKKIKYICYGIFALCFIAFFYYYSLLPDNMNIAFEFI